MHPIESLLCNFFTTWLTAVNTTGYVNNCIGVEVLVDIALLCNRTQQI